MGSTNSHGSEVGGRKRSNADLGVDVEDGGGLAAGGEGLDTDAGEHVVVVLVRGDEVLLEDDLLARVAGEGVAGADGTGLALGEGSITGEAGLDDGKPRRGKAAGVSMFRCVLEEKMSLGSSSRLDSLVS